MSCAVGQGHTGRGSKRAQASRDRVHKGLRPYTTNISCGQNVKAITIIWRRPWVGIRPAAQDE